MRRTATVGLGVVAALLLGPSARAQAPDDTSAASLATDAPPAPTEPPGSSGSEPPPAADAEGEDLADAHPAAESDPTTAAANGSPQARPPAAPTQDPPPPPQGIEGRVVDARTGVGLEQTPVLASGRGGVHTAITEAGGRYRLRLPPGRYTVRSYGASHHGARVGGVHVPPRRFVSLTLRLDPIEDAELSVEEIEVVYRADTSTAAAQDQLRQASVGIGEGMGAAQMSEQGAGDASSAAARVVGVTLDGRQLVVRGLGGRYSRVLLNGAPIPSTDPDRPSVDLDLFPSSVIESFTVSKAFLPDLPGDFAGGLLRIRTVTFPRAFTLSVGASLGVNTQSTFRQRLDYRGGSLDWLGFDDGTRRLPREIPDEPVQVSRNGAYRSFEDIERAGEAFANNWQYRRRTSLPGMGLSLTLGDTIELSGPRRLGYSIALAYDYDSVRETGISRPRPTLADDGTLAVFNDYEVERGVDEVKLGALATTSLDLGPDDSLTLLGLFSQNTSDETQLQTGVSGELGTGERVERWQLQFLSRSLGLGQLLGDHRNLAGSRARLRWSTFVAAGRRDEPDRRSVTYGSQGGQFRWLEKANSGERFFSELEQRDVGGSLSLRFPLWSEAWGTVGGMVHSARRDFLNRRFRFLQDPSNTDQSAYAAPVEELFDEQAIGTLTRLREFTRPDDSYRSRQNLYAAYAMVETPLGGALSASAGARVEIFEQSVRSASPFGDATDDAVEGTSRRDVDVLPGLALKYALVEGMFLRAAYGMTVGRPQIRELAPYQYYDFLRDRNVQGNPDLQRTRIHNVDLRWEWFFGEGEVVALTGFYKRLDAPIELQIRNPDNYDAQFINAEHATNVGAEFELRLGLGRLHPALEALRLQANMTLLSSRVSLPKELSGAVRSDRRLFGTAPYVFNLALTYHPLDADVSLTLTYNVVGPRITDVGTRVNDNVLPDIEAQPFHSLDLVGRWQVSEHVGLKLKVQNLLLQTQDHRQGAFLTQRIDPGASFSLGLTLRY